MSFPKTAVFLLTLCVLTAGCKARGGSPQESGSEALPPLESSLEETPSPEESSASAGSSAPPAVTEMSNEEINETYVKPYGYLIALHEDWSSPDELDPLTVLSWGFYYSSHPDNRSDNPRYGESFTNPPYGYLFPQEEVETHMMERYGVSAERTRAETSAYLPEEEAYALYVFDRGERYRTEVSDGIVSENLLTITVDVLLEGGSDILYTKEMSVQINDGGFRYLGVKTLVNNRQ